MAETQTTVNAPPSGTNAIAVSTIPWNGTTAEAQAVTVREPILGQSVHAGNRTISTLSSATSSSPLYVKTSAGRVCRLINTDNANAETNAVTIIDQASGAANSANVIYSIKLGISQVVELDIPCTTGIGIYAAGAQTSNIVLTWS